MPHTRPLLYYYKSTCLLVQKYLLTSILLYLTSTKLFGYEYVGIMAAAVEAVAC